MRGYGRLIFGMLFLSAASMTHAQPAPNAIFARDGWEAFPGVEYQGGDATQPKKRWGMLVLTDTTIGLYPCVYESCRDGDKKGVKRPFNDPAFFIIPLSAIKDVTSSARSRSASTSEKFFLGGLAGSQSEDFVGLVYETGASAEAPVFKTGKAQSTAVDAKIRFRLKKLGIELQDK